ncbi:YheC/YheD family endospore coat-associated protein [Bacillus sp. FJAT-44742]|uniref:YheC/YheD family endospore coat-associated protein n=1 Tax=Bacillus sp. FJAT-44742 TaxID=2014005 RepID=UPI0012FE9A5D|nr:YheC/YheD family protein [Bacillus sp. FJAT-44742]
MFIKWIPSNFSNYIFISTKLLKMLDMPSSNTILFKFGSWKRELKVQITETLPENTIGLSAALRHEIFIPDELFYEVQYSHNSLSVGPVILYLISSRLIHKLKELKERIERYVPLNGLIMLSTSSWINTEKKTIEGYYFQKGEKRKSTWKKATFSYPGVVFNREIISPELNDILYKETDGKVFNSKFFSKWKMWQWLSSDRFIRNHLPFTMEVNSCADILKYAHRYKSVYLKPKKGSSGKGILTIRQEASHFIITNNKNDITRTDTLYGQELLTHLIESDNRYLLQQDMHVKHKSRNVDFRVYMQKDETQQWKCTGTAARFAVPGRITTNLQNLDYILPGQNAMKEIFQLSKNESRTLEKKVEAICKRACNLIDQYGCFGDIAVDCIIDHHHNVWILEMNKRYGYRSFSYLNDPDLYGQIIKNPFLFASSLAGFSSYTKEPSMYGLKDLHVQSPT